MVPNGWKAIKLKDIANVKRGAGSQYLHYIEGESEEAIRLIRISDFLSGSPKFIKRTEDIERFLLAKGDILIAGTGATAGIVFEIPDELCGLVFSYNAPLIRVSEKVDKGFISVYLKSTHILRQQASLFTGNAQPFLDTKAIGGFSINLPPLPEQKKIAQILSTWDKAITTTEQLLANSQQQKKALIQQLLTGKKRLLDMNGVRFEEEWKWLKASELFKTVSTKNNSDTEELLAVTQDQGVLPRSLLERRVVMPDGSTKGYKLVVPGNFIISLRSFQGGLEYSNYRGLVSPAYTVLEPIKEIDDKFFKHYYKSYDFIGHLAVAVIGIRDGKQISYSDFSFLRIPYPSLEEQQKIAAVLSTADQEITALQQKLDALKQEKKALMQQLLTGKRRVNFL